jgi:hypothetical protein
MQTHLYKASGRKGQMLLFLPEAIAMSNEIMIVIGIRTGIWLNVFSIASSSSNALLPDMKSWIATFWL